MAAEGGNTMHGHFRGGSQQVLWIGISENDCFDVILSTLGIDEVAFSQQRKILLMFYSIKGGILR